MNIALQNGKPDFKIKSNGKWTSTQYAVSAFSLRLPRMGRIVRITGTAANRQYRVRFISDAGKEFEFEGFSWWYRGEGPTGLAKCLRSLRVDDAAINKLIQYSTEAHGHVDHPNCFFINLDQTASP